ncbi:hypothetical protein XMM379_000801 [Aliiroseovarius sp. xm-m-379]|uniref:Ferrochelatase n=1 Tax=Aliiroseovarius crassostreae TaxID=154981 RepID=A0A9Q9HC69_9RHOB|nr:MULTISPECIES: hypothetical protein [Aliiroseovarius]NRP13044.1 hypothetical protein [Aliiroseovarius sp. xm-d-517]NRP24121.1 hypothetical protein [Aliiroseovarius sp. xm-m-379]NRP30067.1 hypothetical protein [Aliiroseovarius sp. xm-m-314]NRP32920.1 hypothetical protein [Aliiroseovarius sp. xm-a-104]NRP40077.1 hypothetical protein [Aliiroseovarius sp. xm-m-339-2]
MKKVIALAAAGLIAATPLVAGNLENTVVEPELVVVEEAGSSLNGTTGALLGLALLAGIIAVASDS